MFRPLHSRAWDVQADTAGLERLRELNRRHPLVFLPSHRSYVDPLVLADVLAAPRLPAQPRARRRQPALLAGRAAGQARRDRLHPPQLRRRPGLQARRPRVLRLPARQALQPRVVHGGRPLADRQAAPAAARAAALRRRRRRARPGRRRPPRAGVDHLRPAPRGLADGGRAGRRRQARRGPVVAGLLRPGAGEHAARHGARRASASRCRWRRRCEAGADPADPGRAAAHAAEGRLRGRRRHQLGHAGDGDGAGHPRPARGPRPRADPRPGAARASSRCSATSTSAACRTPARRCARSAGRGRCSRTLAGQGVVTVYEGGEEPVYAIERGQHLVAAFYRNSAIHHFVDRAIAELVMLGDPARPLGRGDAAARPAEVRVLLPRAGRLPGADRRRAGAPRPGVGDRRRPRGAVRGRRCWWRTGCCGRSSTRSWWWPSGSPRAIRARRSSRPSSWPSAAGSGSRCCCRAGCTGPSRCRGSCSPRALQLAAQPRPGRPGPRGAGPPPAGVGRPGARRRRPGRGHRRAGRRGAAGERGSGAVSVGPGTGHEPPGPGEWTEEQLLADVEAGPRGPAGRRVLRLRRHGDRRLLARRLRPAPPAVAARDARRPGAAAAHRPARRHHRGGLREVHRRRHEGLGRAQRGRAGRARRAAVRPGHRRLALPRGVAAGDRAPAGRPHRRPGLVGDPLPGRARGPRHGRRAHPGLAGRDRGRHLHRPARRPAALAGRQGGRPCGPSPHEHDIDLARSYAYSNGDEDVPFLRTVGRARALNPGSGLVAAARHYSWPIARFRRPRPRRAAETSPARWPASAGCSAASRPGMAIGALSGSRREAVDLGITLGGELGSALAGVRLDVQGAEHLATRPAVFLFNHQSQLDVLVLAKLLRGGFTAVAKKELANAPGFGLDVPPRRRGLRRPRRPGEGARGAGAGGAAAARGDLAGHRAGGHPLARRRTSARSRRAPSTSRCRPACRSSRSSSATPAS